MLLRLLSCALSNCMFPVLQTEFDLSTYYYLTTWVKSLLAAFLWCGSQTSITSSWAKGFVSNAVASKMVLWGVIGS